MNKPQIRIQSQGKCIVEPDGSVFLVMTPDGNIQGAPSRKAAEKICSAFFKKSVAADSVGVGEIEWRNQ